MRTESQKTVQNSPKRSQKQQMHQSHQTPFGRLHPSLSQKTTPLIVVKKVNKQWEKNTHSKKNSIYSETAFETPLKRN